MSQIQALNTAYGLSQALLNIFPTPIIAQRAPTVNDKAQLGTTWIDKVNGFAYVITQIVNNQATWVGAAGGELLTSLTVTPGPISLTGTTDINVTGAAVTTIGTGGTGVVDIGNATGGTLITGPLNTTGALTVAAGGITVTTGGLDVAAGGATIIGTTDINTAGAASTFIASGGTGAVDIGNVTGGTAITGLLTAASGIDVTAGGATIIGNTNINTVGAGITQLGTAGTGAVNIGNTTGNTAITGTLTTGGNLTVTAGGAAITGTTTINTVGAAATTIATGGTGTLALGNATGNTAVTGSLTASTTLTATAGNITATAGNMVISTATKGILLPGPTQIINGAGAPAAGLALEVGDIYINNTAASATTRIYVATAAGTWTNVTCAG